MRIIEGAESFLLDGKNNKAVLLLHGYTGAPSEMRPLGDYLHALGYTVSCVRLPGHGTSIKDLEATTATDWYGAAEAECLELLARFDSVYVAGLSMGGLLAMKLAAKLPVKKAALSNLSGMQRQRLPLFRHRFLCRISVRRCWRSCAFSSTTCLSTRRIIRSCRNIASPMPKCRRSR